MENTIIQCNGLSKERAEEIENSFSWLTVLQSSSMFTKSEYNLNVFSVYAHGNHIANIAVLGKSISIHGPHKMNEVISALEQAASAVYGCRCSITRDGSRFIVGIHKSENIPHELMRQADPDRTSIEKRSSESAMPIKSSDSDAESFKRSTPSSIDYDKNDNEENGLHSGTTDTPVRKAFVQKLKKLLSTVSEKKKMKPCHAFSFADAAEAYKHIMMHRVIIEDYGKFLYGHALHTWDNGRRMLAKCSACGGYILIQSSEFHSFTDSPDSYYTDFFPVSSPEEANELNRRYSGDEIEKVFGERYLMETNGHLMWSDFNLFRLRRNRTDASESPNNPVTDTKKIDPPMPVLSVQKPHSEEIVINRLTDTLWWTFRDGMLMIGGEGEMPDFAFRRPKAFPWPDRETVSVVILDGVRSIGAGSFLNCSNLSRIILPEGLIKIGACAFQYSGIEKIALPDGLAYIEESVFESCKQLSEVIIPDSVVEIKQMAFRNCEKLTHVALPNALKKIGRYAFFGTGIREIDLPNGLEMIRKNAFRYLSHLTIPDSVTQIETPIAYPCTVQLPKGREDMPVFDPKTNEDYFRQFAYQFFSARSNVLEEPTGDPANDRYTAIARLTEIAEQYFHAKPNRLYDSYACEGKLFFCSDVKIEYGDSCADGGCGPNYETIPFGVTFCIITENELFCQRSEMQLAQTEPFPIWKSKGGKQCLLYHPLGLRDCFSINSDYAVHITG